LRGHGDIDLVVFGSDFQYGLTIGGSIYFGHPDGSFDPPLLLPLNEIGGFGATGNGAAIADLNGDGLADIFLTTQSSQQPLGTYVLRGLGDGTFPLNLQTLVPVQALFPHVVVTDLNNDSRPDAIISDQTSNHGVWVLLNTTSSERVP
jgi:FG-GAP-like repeat